LISPATDRDLGDSIIENCYFTGAKGTWGTVLTISSFYNVIIRGNTIIGAEDGVVITSVAAPEVNFVYDNFFFNNTTAIDEDIADSVDEDSNLFSSLDSGLFEGANSVEKHLQHIGPLLLSGYKFPTDHCDVVGFNQYRYLVDNQNLDKDIFGLKRPASPKKSPGAVQYKGVVRDPSEYKTSPASIRMDDASIYIMNVPIDGGKKVTARIYVKREADYSGQAPQIALSLPTQGRVVATDSGPTGIYNRLSATFKTNPADRWLQIEIRSNNIATSGNYKVWFDDLKISASAATIPTMKWITNEIPLFTFALDDVLDPWVTTTMPVPGATLGPVGLLSEVNPLPSFYKQQ
jgi:hypothetical protein